MKFVISRGELAELIRKIQNIVPQNPPIPILSNFLVEAAKDELVFTATDLTVGARVAVKAKVTEEGGITLPSRRFFQLVRELNDATIEVAADADEVAEIKTGSSLFRLKGMRKQEFPELPNLAEAIQFTLSSDLLKEMFFRTAFAVSKEDGRFAVTGLLMQINEGKAIFVGTDGKRLAKIETEVTATDGLNGDYILPLKAVDEMLKILNPGEQVIFYLTHDKVAIESSQSLLVAKLLSGKYPDYRQLTATTPKTFVILHREELMTLLRQVALFMQDTSHSVRFSFQKGELVLTANSADIGEGRVSMAVDYQGDKLDIAFNPHYFLDILRHCKDETVSFGLTDAYNPGILTDSTQALFVIMPMRLNLVTD